MGLGDSISFVDVDVDANESVYFTPASGTTVCLNDVWSNGSYVEMYMTATSSYSDTGHHSDGWDMRVKAPPIHWWDNTTSPNHTPARGMRNWRDRAGANLGLIINASNALRFKNHDSRSSQNDKQLVVIGYTIDT